MAAGSGKAQVLRRPAISHIDTGSRWSSSRPHVEEFGGGPARMETRYIPGPADHRRFTIKMAAAVTFAVRKMRCSVMPGHLLAAVGSSR